MRAVARNVAICLTALGDYDRALELLDDAIATCRERGFTGREYSAQTEKAIVLTMQRRPARSATRSTSRSTSRAWRPARSPS